MIKINPDFQKLIPPLSAEEKIQLESNLIADGCRDPLVLWGDTLIDGHNRYEICTRLNIPFQTISKQFDSENAVKLWMIDNQRGRRNLTDGWRFQLARVKIELLKANKNADKNEWIKKSRSEFLQLNPERKTCFICGKYKAIAEAHHVYPLAMQYDDGIKTAIQDFVWLCPTHHAVAHLVIAKGSIFDCINEDDLLSDFTREEIDRISALNKAFVSLKLGV